MLRLEPPDVGALFVVSGPSGVGKTTLIQAALQHIPGLEFSVSATTRAPRPGEKDGREYHFLDAARFDALVAEDAFLEHASVYDRQYGTMRAPVVEAIAAGRSVLLDIDVQGARQVKSRFPECIRICLLPKSIRVLEERLRARGTDEDTLARRMAQVGDQLRGAPEFDYVVVNDDLETAIAMFVGVFCAELSRTGRRRAAVDRVLAELTPPLVITRSALDKLGKRLGASTDPAETDVGQLFAWQNEHVSAIRAVVASIQTTVGPRFARPLVVTHRLKTIGTLLDKLRRGTALSRMQDIAGVRIVAQVGLTQQDEIVRCLLDAFPEARVEDRRAKPSHGYRAVHVVAPVEGYRVEIQVRTGLQHAWANATERAADRYGRGIRYGQDPIATSPLELEQRRAEIRNWLLASDCLAAIEQAGEDLAAVLRTRFVGDPSVSPHSLLQKEPALTRDVRAAADRLRAVLTLAGPDLSSAMMDAMDEVTSGLGWHDEVLPPRL